MNKHAEALLTDDASAWRVFSEEFLAILYYLTR